MVLTIFFLKSYQHFPLFAILYLIVRLFDGLLSQHFKTQHEAQIFGHFFYFFADKYTTL